MLGVVGLVLGGLWIAASAVMENHKVNKTFEGINFIVTNVQKSMTIEASDATGWNHITDFVRAVGGFPKDWGPQNSLYVVSPVGAEVHVYNRTQSFVIWVRKLSKPACIKLAVKLSNFSFRTRGTPISSSFITIPSTPPLYFTDNSATPWTLAQVSSSCANNPEIDLEYRYTRLR